MIQSLHTTGWDDYELVDTGNSKRLERFGTVFVVRPEASAMWEPAEPNHKGWQRPDAIFEEGEWIYKTKGLGEGWNINWGGITLHVKPTRFRHLGIFPEQELQWQWLDSVIRQATQPVCVLNLFGYTGVASLVAARAGADVCHVDASKPSVYYASEQAKRNELEQSVRWIVDDVRKFLQREIRRGNQYDVILLDPPVFGRGSKGEIWRLEDELAPLLALVAQVLSKTALGVVMNVYATDLYPIAIQRVFEEQLKLKKSELATTGIIQSSGEKVLQTGYCFRS